MKKTVFLIFMLCMLVKLSAQECVYFEYNQMVESANKYYADKNYKQSQSNLKLAFSKTSFPLGKDLELSINVAEKLNDSDWIKELSITLAKGGVPVRYFQKFKKHAWFDRFISDFPKYEAHYYSNYNSNLRENFNKLIDRDAKFTEKLINWHYGKIKMTAEEAYQEAHEIYSEFMEMNKKNGLPSEQIMGYNYVRHLNKIQEYKTGILISNIYKRGELIFQDKIKDFVCNGFLHPNFENFIMISRGYGDSTGIKQEMNVRYNLYNQNKK
jgi:hypothetical protein